MSFWCVCLPHIIRPAMDIILPDNQSSMNVLLLYACYPCKRIDLNTAELTVLQDGVAMLWDLAEGKRLYSLDAGDVIHALTFSPNRYWLCAATQQGVKVWSSVCSCLLLQLLS